MYEKKLMMSTFPRSDVCGLDAASSSTCQGSTRTSSGGDSIWEGRTLVLVSSYLHNSPGSWIHVFFYGRVRPHSHKLVYKYIYIYKTPLRSIKYGQYSLTLEGKITRHLGKLVTHFSPPEAPQRSPLACWLFAGPWYIATPPKKEIEVCWNGGTPKWMVYNGKSY